MVQLVAFQLIRHPAQNLITRPGSDMTAHDVVFGKIISLAPGIQQHVVIGDLQFTGGITRHQALFFQLPDDAARKPLIWVASRAISGKGKTGVEATELFRQARALLARVDPYAPKVNRKSAKALHDRLQTFQNEYKNQQWGPVRIIHNWDLLLVEQALAICLWYSGSPAHGYKLAADYCQHYDSRHGNGLNGPSRKKIEEMARFVNKLEEMQEKRR